jgi:hypothetical protein
MSAGDEISKPPSNSPMPTYDPAQAASNDDCDALATHARNRLQSDPDARYRDTRRHFPFVAHRAVSDPLLLRRLVKLKGK